MNKMREFINLSHEIYDSSDVEVCALLICQYAVNFLHADGCAVYLYDKLKRCHDFINSYGVGEFDLNISLEENKCLSFKSFRGLFECGGIVVHSRVENNKKIYDDIAKLIVILYNRKFAIDMFLNSSKPIDFLQDEDRFYSDLRDLARSSSQMPAGALRLKESSFLRTLFCWNDWNNWEENIAVTSDWDITDESIFPSIKECIDRKKVVVLSQNDLYFSYFQRPMQVGVKSAIFCPIVVGKEIMGTLSFALPINYSFSEIEKLGFLNLANSIGVAITNFSRAATDQVALHDDIRVSQILTAVEVAQAARHSARADLDTLKTYINIIRRLNDKGIEKTSKSIINENIEECEAAIQSCFKSLDDIKSAIRPPAKTIEYASLKNLFDRAKNQMRGKIVKYKIDVQWADADVVIQCFPDHLMQVFLNLLLNSIDAFSSYARKGNRFVKCRVHDLQERSEIIKLRIEDNAGGIDVQKLKISANDFDSQVEDLVFQKDVTTKGREGSGWGLYVSRKIVKDHGGHMSLIEYRNKTVFELELRKNLTP
jgi:signal transduction histidine kinase